MPSLSKARSAASTTSTFSLSAGSAAAMLAVDDDPAAGGDVVAAVGQDERGRQVDEGGIGPSVGDGVDARRRRRRTGADRRRGAPVVGRTPASIVPGWTTQRCSLAVFRSVSSSPAGTTAPASSRKYGTENASPGRSSVTVIWARARSAPPRSPVDEPVEGHVDHVELEVEAFGEGDGDPVLEAAVEVVDVGAVPESRRRERGGDDEGARPRSA